MKVLHDIKEALLHLAFPHVCAGCGSDVLDKDNFLCLRCLDALPQTFFALHNNNPIEKIFWGRLPVTNATAQYYFTRGSVMQTLMHGFKYRGNKELGFYLGQLMGQQLQQSNRFQNIDAIIPLPLFAAKEKARGFNQATILCNGIAAVLQKPVLQNVVARVQQTESQTKKNRVARWQNMEGMFAVTGAKQIEGKHLLLVDDVLTTGATLEACGAALVQVPGVQLSIATLCFSVL